MKKEIHAVIGVWTKKDKAFYVLRSPKMENYPGVWGLLSLRHEAGFLNNPYNIRRAQLVLQQLSDERLCGAKIRTHKFLCKGSSDENPYDMMVHLNLYQVEFSAEPELNTDYYTDSAWMTPEQAIEANNENQSGFCTRLWQEYLRENES